MSIKLPFGLQFGKLVEISSVYNGLACNCFCPACGKQLIAKKGHIKEYHFAHYNSEECRGAIETALHIYAKNILEKNNSIALPPVYIANKLIFPSKKVIYDKVLLEKRIDNFIPDIIIHINTKPLLIEVSVTHFVDYLKTSKILNLGYAAIEIDVKSLFNATYYKTFNFEDFEKRLVEEADFKTWINNPKQNFIKEKVKKLAIIKKAITLDADYTYLKYVTNCPLNKRAWKSGYKQGQRYASFYDDCQRCPFGEATFDEVHCFGHKQKEITTIIEDFVNKNSTP